MYQKGWYDGREYLDVTIGCASEWMAGCVNRRKRTTSNDRVLEWETTAK
jgi:hypothetical protein